MLSDDQVRDYLDRIGFREEPFADLATLDELTYLHQCTIPFETVTLYRSGAIPVLETDVIFDKVVTRRLGGYCFELNKLFCELLTTLGFDARPVLSRAVRGRDYRMPINHRGMLVQLDEGSCSVDVGFGGPMPAGVLILAHDCGQIIHGDVYNARKNDPSWWKIERITHASRDLYDDDIPERRQVELELCTAQVEEMDFDALNEKFSGPGTLFRDHMLCNLRIEGGYYGLKDNELTIRRYGKKEIIPLENDEAILVALDKYFGMRDIDAWVEEMRTR